MEESSTTEFLVRGDGEHKKTQRFVNFNETLRWVNGENSRNFYIPR